MEDGGGQEERSSDERGRERDARRLPPEVDHGGAVEHAGEHVAEQRRPDEPQKDQKRSTPEDPPEPGARAEAPRPLPTLRQHCRHREPQLDSDDGDEECNGRPEISCPERQRRGADCRRPQREHHGRRQPVDAHAAHVSWPLWKHAIRRSSAQHFVSCRLRRVRGQRVDEDRVQPPAGDPVHSMDLVEPGRHLDETDRLRGAKVAEEFEAPVEHWIQTQEDGEDSEEAHERRPVDHRHRLHRDEEHGGHSRCRGAGRDQPQGAIRQMCKLVGDDRVPFAGRQAVQDAVGEQQGRRLNAEHARERLQVSQGPGNARSRDRNAHPGGDLGDPREQPRILQERKRLLQTGQPRRVQHLQGHAGSQAGGQRRRAGPQLEAHGAQKESSERRCATEERKTCRGPGEPADAPPAFAHLGPSEREREAQEHRQRPEEQSKLVHSPDGIGARAAARIPSRRRTIRSHPHAPGPVIRRDSGPAVVSLRSPHPLLPSFVIRGE